jgi:nucleoside-diphosphate-sugar epimerase
MDPSAAQSCSFEEKASEHMSETVLILGSKGRIGAALTEAFSARGWSVVAQARRGEATQRGAVRTVTIGLEDTAGLARAAEGASVVAYAVNPIYTDWTAQVMPLARQGMAVAEALGATFVLPGNVYNFGAGMPAVLREDAPQSPTSKKGRIRVELEREMESRAPTLKSAVLRAGDFFGGGPGSWFDLVVTKSLREGKLVYPGPTDLPHAWAYLPDLARAFVALCESPALPAFSRWHFEGHTLTGEQLLSSIERVANAMGLGPSNGRWSRGTMPWWALRLGSPFVAMWGELAEMRYLWSTAHALDGGALEARVGKLEQTPLDEAIRRSIAPASA